MTLILSGQANAQEDPGYVPGAWRYRSVRCVETTVRRVEPRLEVPGQTHFTARDFAQSGVEVTFDTHLGLEIFGSDAFAQITHYQGSPGNQTMSSAHRGDRVQLCFLGGPAPTKYCDPDKDLRGRQYRAYDYRRKSQYWGANGEHLCGGA